MNLVYEPSNWVLFSFSGLATCPLRERVRNSRLTRSQSFYFRIRSAQFLSWLVGRRTHSVYSAMLELTDEDIRLRLGRNSAREVKQLTSPTEVAKKYSTIYQKVLST